MNIDDENLIFVALPDDEPELLYTIYGGNEIEILELLPERKVKVRLTGRLEAYAGDGNYHGQKYYTNYYDSEEPFIVPQGLIDIHSVMLRLENRHIVEKMLLKLYELDKQYSETERVAS